MTLPPEWVFFDAVDTLFRIRGSVGGIYARVAARHGVRVSPTALENAFRGAICAAPPLFFPMARPDETPRLERLWWRDIVARTFAGRGEFASFDDFFSEVFAHFATASPWERCPGAGAVPALLQRAGLRLAVVSDMDGRLEDVLGALDLRDEFEAVLLASRSGTRKRDGSLFRHALAVTGARAGAVVHVGDNVQTDVAGAQQAGITPIHYDPDARGGTPEGVLAVRSLRDLPRILGGAGAA